MGRRNNPLYAILAGIINGGQNLIQGQARNAETRRDYDLRREEMDYRRQRDTQEQVHRQRAMGAQFQGDLARVNPDFAREHLERGQDTIMGAVRPPPGLADRLGPGAEIGPLGAARSPFASGPEAPGAVNANPIGHNFASPIPQGRRPDQIEDERTRSNALRAALMGYVGGLPDNYPKMTADVPKLLEQASGGKPFAVDPGQLGPHVKVLEGEDRLRLEGLRTASREKIANGRIEAAKFKNRGDFLRDQAKAYLDDGGRPELVDQWLEGRGQIWDSVQGGQSTGSGPAGGDDILPAMLERISNRRFGQRAPSEPNFFPQGTAGQALIRQRDASAGLSEARTADIPAAAADRAARTQAYVESVKSSNDYRKSMSAARNVQVGVAVRRFEAEKDWKQRGFRLQEAKEAFDQKLDLTKHALQVYKTENAEKLNPLVQADVKLLDARIGRIETERNVLESKLAEKPDSATQKQIMTQLGGLSTQLQGLLSERKGILGHLNGASGNKAAVGALLNDVVKPNGGGGSNRSRYKKALIGGGASEAQAELMAKRRYPAGR